MEKKQTNQGVMVRDTMIYMIAKCIEAVMGVLTMSAMTYLFASEQMGAYSTINIAITTIGMVAIQWLAQATLRFVNKYDVENRKDEFFTTVFSAWIRTTGFVVCLSGIIVVLIQFVIKDAIVIGNFLLKDSVSTIIVGTLWFVTYNASQLVVAMVAALRESRLNLLLSIITVVGKLFFIVLFCELWGSRVEWIFLSYFITDGIVSLIGILKLKLYRYIVKHQASKEILHELKAYGTPLMGNMLTTSVLNKSDIYIVTFFLGASAAGIYQTNYSLVATAFTMLSSAVMRGSYPTVLRVWSEGKKELSTKLISNAARLYLLLAIPAVVGVGMLSDVIAKSLYAPEYFTGHDIMVWVALGMMFLGLTEYNIKPWELNAKSKCIFRRSLIGGVVNVALNLLLVPFVGYKVAAFTTFIGFLVYFVLARYGTRKYDQWSLPIVVYVRIIASALGMAIVLFGLKQILPFNVVCLALMVIIGIIVYGVLLILFGELKEESTKLINWLQDKRRD